MKEYWTQMRNDKNDNKNAKSAFLQLRIRRKMKNDGIFGWLKILLPKNRNR
jgi:hypothetical protein